jgi:hypothetical protein
MSLKEDLIAARALIDTPEKWTKGSWLRRDGTMCAEGACRRTGKAASPLRPHDRIIALFAALEPGLPAGCDGSIARYNDDPATTHADVMSLFDRAIELAS